MRRRGLLLLLGVLAIAVGAVVVGSSSAPEDDNDGAYRVRAIFDNAFAVVPGDEVRAAGARIGSVETTDVTPDRQAVLVLRIDDAAFRDFRADAECTVRPQSVVETRAVECLPTQPRGTGSTLPAPLDVVAVGGQRQRLLPVSRTSKPVDLDLIAGLDRLSERRRVAIVLNDLGVGLAGRGDELRRAIRAALPGLRDTDRVLELLGDQNRRLRALAADGDRALRPIAAERRALGAVVARTATASRAVADRRSDLDADLRRLPATLAELRPTARELSRVARQGIPAVRDLRRTAPAGQEVLGALRPLSAAAVEPVRALGRSADDARTTLTDADPVIRRLGRTATAAAPALQNAGALTTSLRRSGGFRRLLDAVYFQVLAINAYDDVGHYLRVNATIGPCSVLAATPVRGCSARFSPDDDGALPAAGTARRAGETPEATLGRRVLAGEPPSTVLRRTRGVARYRTLTQRLARLQRRRGDTQPGRTTTRTPSSGATDTPIEVQDDPIPSVTGPLDEASRLFRALLGGTER